MELTREQAIKEYREHWDWCSWNPSKRKDESPNIAGKHILHNCFLCHFAANGTFTQECKNCPVEWPQTNNEGMLPCAKSYYGDWEQAKLPEERSRLAALIRDLPEKEEKKKICFGPEGITINDGSKVLKKLEFPFGFVSVEEKTALKVGDWVKYIGNHSKVKGKSGIIREIDAELAGIEFDDNVSGHELGNRYSCKHGHGWSVKLCDIELADGKPINCAPIDYELTESTTFIFQGNKTTCIIEIDGKEFVGEYEFPPTDEWSEKTGRQWAHLRAIRKMTDAMEKELRK